MSIETASLVPCGVMTRFGAVNNVAKVEPGSKMLVFGTGSIGLNVLQACKLVGTSVIVALDTNPAKEAVARDFGATDFISPADDGIPLDKQIKALLGGCADHAFDCVGHPAIVKQAVGLESPYWGVMVAVGIAPVTDQIRLSASTFYFGRSICGTFIGDCNPVTDSPKILDHYHKGRLAIDGLITHRTSFDEINTGIDLMKSGKANRTVIVF